MTAEERHQNTALSSRPYLSVSFFSVQPLGVTQCSREQKELSRSGRVAMLSSASRCHGFERIVKVVRESAVVFLRFCGVSPRNGSFSALPRP